MRVVFSIHDTGVSLLSGYMIFFQRQKDGSDDLLYVFLLSGSCQVDYPCYRLSDMDGSSFAL